MGEQVYRKINPLYINTISDEDIIVLNDGREAKPRILSFYNYKVEIDMNNELIDIDISNVRSIKKTAIPTVVRIEPGDLVSFTINSVESRGIIKEVNNNNVTLITYTQNNLHKEYIVPKDTISFLAKGYVSEFDTSHLMDNGMALLYPAPCIIMAVPPDNDPASYPNEMAVEFPWSNNKNKTKLPVIRMAPGTMVVVVPSATQVLNRFKHIGKERKESMLKY